MTIAKNRRCLVVIGNIVTLGCHCDHCNFNRIADRLAHQRCKAKNPTRFTARTSASARRARIRNKLADPEGYAARKTRESRRYRAKHYQRWRNRLSQMNYHWKAIVFTRYGNVCACCGETTFEFLTIEHKNGGGQLDRKKHGGQQFYRHIASQGFPDIYEILCYNCNCAKGIHGSCPHERCKAIMVFPTTDRNRC